MTWEYGTLIELLANDILYRHGGGWGIKLPPVGLAVSSLSFPWDKVLQAPQLDCYAPSES
jgi:hypothetical protein